MTFARAGLWSRAKALGLILHLHLNVPQLGSPNCGLLTGLVPCCNAKQMLVQIHDVQSYIYKWLVRLHSVPPPRWGRSCLWLASASLWPAESAFLPFTGLSLVVFVTLVPSGGRLNGDSRKAGLPSVLRLVPTPRLLEHNTLNTPTGLPVQLAVNLLQPLNRLLMRGTAWRG